jgi:hypothetical protein
MNLRRLSLTFPLLLASACASASGAANEKAERSSASIRAAEEVGATHHPDAALYLQLAKEQFQQAEALNHKDKEAADRLLLRAQADAELALALARSEDEKAEALGAIDKVKKLKQSAPQ